MKNKDEKYWQILNSCIQLEMSHGHLKWKLSDLHRKSKVSRSLIYYYFGQSKKDIVLEACHYFGSFLSGTDPELMDLYEKGQTSEALFKVKQLLLKVPALVPFYFLYRGKEGEIGDIITDCEAKGIKKRRLLYPHLSDVQTKALFAIQMGLTLSNKLLSQRDLDISLEMVNLL